ncbi:MAG: HD domain-containing phosphohydrolase [Actinomycetota bacterium]
MGQSWITWRYSLRFQFILVALIALVFLVTAFVFVQIYIPGLFTKQADRDSLNLSRMVALRIEQHLEEIERGVEAIASIPAVQSVDPAERESALLHALKLSPHLNRIYILDSRGIMITHVPPNPEFIGKNYSNAEYFREAMRTRKVHFSDVFIESGEPVIVATAPITGTGGETLGVVNGLVSIRKSEIGEFLSRLKIGERGYPVLVDRRGTLIFHPDQERVLRQENIGVSEPAKRVLRGQEGTIVVNFDNLERVLSFTPVSKARWGVIIARPVAEVYPYVLWVRIIIGAGLVLGLGLVGFFYWHGRRVVLGPVSAVAEGINQVSAGNFDYKVPLLPTQEMDRLGKTFNSMVQVLATCYRVSGVLNSLASLPDIENYILDEISRTFETETAAIMLFDEQDRLKIQFSRGFPEEAVEAHNRRELGRKDLSRVFGEEGAEKLSKGETLLLEAEQAPILRRVVPLKEIHFLYVFPLRVEEKMKGLVIVFSPSEAPFTQEKVQSVAGMASHIAVAIERSDLYDRLYQSYAQTTRAMAQAIDAKDPYSRGHSKGVAKIAVEIAKELGMTADEIRGIEIAAYLHDVGKIGISEELLRKPVMLSHEERQILETHPTLSAQILSPIEFPWPVLEAVAHHHERFIGEGYPDKIKAEEILLGARILAVADAFEAMTSDRPYRSALSKREAAKEIRRESGSQFDPKVVEALLRVVEKEKPKRKEKKKGEKDQTG